MFVKAYRFLHRELDGMKHLIIIGVGGFAREVYWHAQESLGYRREWDLKGFLDGDVRLDEKEYGKLSMPLLGNVENYQADADDVFICAVGTPKVRYRLTSIIEKRGGKFINLIHRTSIIHGTVKMGTGNVLCPYTNLNDHSVIGNHLIFNGHSGIGHDGKAGDYSCFMGGASLMGYASVGERVYFADGAVAMPHSIVEDDAYVGIRSVVFKRVKSGQRVFGNPALPI